VAETPTRQNLAAEAMTKRMEDAARLVAEDDLSNEAISARVGVTRQTLDLWKKRPEFVARVAQHREAFKDAALSEGFADKRERVRALNAVATAVLTQLAAEDYQGVIGVDREGEPIEGFDVQRLREFRGLLSDLAKEMGDRRQGVDLNVTGYRERAERIAAEIGKPELAGEIERDMVLRHEALRGAGA
jgi:hypothetical protein